MPDFKIVTLLFLITVPLAAVAQDSQQRGLEIAKAASGIQIHNNRATILISGIDLLLAVDGH